MLGDVGVFPDLECQQALESIFRKVRELGDRERGRALFTAPGALAIAASTIAVIAIGGAILALRRRLLIVTVSGESMQPAVASGDRVLVRRAGLDGLRPGDVVVVERPTGARTWATPPSRWPAGPGNWMIKRVAALPGDPCPDPPALAAQLPSKLAAFAGQPVPPGKLVVLGDNQSASYDSRIFGYYPADRVLGVVIRPVRLR